MTANDFYTRRLARSAALVLIDAQRDFLDIPGENAPMPVDGTRAAIPAMAKLPAAFRERGLPIVHVVRLYRAGWVERRPGAAAIDRAGCANCRTGRYRLTDRRRIIAQCC